MKQWDSTLKNMVLSLGLISILSAAALGVVHELTAEPIRQAEMARQTAAVRMVVPAFDNDPIRERYIIRTPEGDSLICFPASYKGKKVGVAVESYSKKGFGGEIRIMVGFDSSGTIRNYTVLKHKETPGLGSKMQEWFQNGSGNILGLNPGKNNVWVSKDGGQVDGITAATISSRAFLEAVNRAYKACWPEKGKTDSQKRTTSYSSAKQPAKTVIAISQKEIVKREETIEKPDTSST
jgi:electron transport complex protein RnfG